MLASGRAVVGTADAGTGLGDVLAECGVCVAPGDAAALAEAIVALADNATQRHILGNRCRVYAEQHFGRDKILEAVEAQLHILCQQSNDIQSSVVAQTSTTQTNLKSK